MTIPLTELLPRWTKRVVTAGGGRDPLGLSRVGFMLTDYLLNGIITTTDRARYYSFYCWCIWHIDNEETPRTYDEFVGSFRRREAVMAMASYAANPAVSPVGVEVVRNQVERGRQAGKYDPDFKVLPSNELGGYGQYYAGSMYDLRLTTRDEGYIHHVTEGGAKIAETFHRSVADTRYLTQRGFTSRSLDGALLQELETCFTLDAISAPLAKGEREELIDLFWSLGQPRADEQSILRKQTLTLLLHTISAYGERGVYPNIAKGERLDEYLLYAFYYDVLWIGDDKYASLTHLAGHELCMELWRQFCLHQFITQALESLLFAVVEEVGGEPAGLTAQELVSRLTSSDFLDELEEIVEVRCETPSALLQVFGIADQPPSKLFSEKARKKYRPGNPKSEHGIMSKVNNRTANNAAVTTALLAVLYAKWGGLTDERAPLYVAQRAGNELWCGAVLPYIDKWRDSSLTWQQALSDLIDDAILNQHDRIMYEKRRLDSSWIQRSDGRIKKNQDFSPGWRASRFLNAVRIMVDLNLLEATESKEVMITDDGTNLLQKLLAEE